MLKLLFLLLPALAHARVDTCELRITVSHHRLHSLELLGHRHPNFFLEQTSSQRLLMVGEITDLLQKIEGALPDSPEDEYTAQMRRTLAVWRGNDLIELIYDSIDAEKLRVDGRPYQLLRRSLIEDVARGKVLLAQIRPVIAFDFVFNDKMSWSRRRDAIVALILDTEPLLKILSGLRDRVDLKNEDLERINRLLTRIDEDLFQDMFFKVLLRKLPNLPEPQLRYFGREFEILTERMKIISAYLRARGARAHPATSPLTSITN